MSALLEAPHRSTGDAPSPRRRRARPGLALVTTVLALALMAVLAFHDFLPDLFGLGLLVDSALPWFGLLIPVLLVVALVSRSLAAIGAAVASVLVWAVLFVPAIVPLGWNAPAASGTTLTVASQNVEADSGTAAESATALAATGAQVIALQEMDDAAREEVSAVLDESYPYSYGIGTVGVWSTYPIENAQMLDLGLGWQRGIAADLSTPAGLVSIYVVHAASARPGDHATRDEMLANLADYVPRDENERLVMVGDFNAGSSDRHFSALAAQLDEPNQDGGGFGFTWPAGLPVTRPDHILQRGMKAVSSTTISAGASDHLAIVATLQL
ncbi:endonuclease/exonuclease/phosphatase family protein [Herbiconiux moechotypicola]|uniref:Teicoplanin resistance protein VanJ n=1 Tax=Herbiconiux moechotypicola TaxID=637393 RepID=A0ABP5QDH1_9MICO|nr:endonuclease/exonuclease/phosphatase family protein [Herbiconiux moechotypicola]MCS5729778.1 endonuclease/exonuclease/phosphatase family protein [Herbiconiux moechotypicola]